MLRARSQSLALSPPLEYSSEEVRALLSPLRNRLSVALYAHENAFSVGGIIRVAHSFLVREIFIIGTEPYYPKASMGMHHFEQVCVMRDEDAFLDATKGRPLWAVEREHATRGLYDPEPFADDVVFMFGSERQGLPPALLERADVVVGIPMYGINNSFPVSVAAGMVLAEWGRRFYRPGRLVPERTG